MSDLIQGICTRYTLKLSLHPGPPARGSCGLPELEENLIMSLRQDEPGYRRPKSLFKF